jgi:hypothetical protein
VRRPWKRDGEKVRSGSRMASAGVQSIGLERIFGGEGEFRSVLLRRRLYCL